MILAEYDAEDTMRGFYEDGRAEGFEEGRKEGRQEGWQKGQRDGLRKGRKEGFEAGKIDLIKRMLQNGINPEIIAQSAGIPLEKISAYL